MQVASAPPPAPLPAPAATPVDATPSNPPDELWLAATSGDVKALQSALAGNVAVDAFDENGETALVLAIQHSHVEAVRALLAHGANPNTPDSHGLTPIRAARIRDNFAIKTALEHNGKH
jgi:ankyrin repeat protein